MILYHVTSRLKTQIRFARLQHTCRLLLLPRSSFPFTRFKSSSAAAAVLLISFNECLRTEKRGGIGKDEKLKMGELKPMLGVSKIFTSASYASEPLSVYMDFKLPITGDSDDQI